MVITIWFVFVMYYLPLNHPGQFNLTSKFLCWVSCPILMLTFLTSLHSVTVHLCSVRSHKGWRCPEHCTQDCVCWAMCSYMHSHAGNVNYGLLFWPNLSRFLGEMQLKVTIKGSHKRNLDNWESFQFSGSAFPSWFSCASPGPGREEE